jgi:hypothetical protein
MRIWLQKQKKKEEAKAAAQAATPVPETTPAATEAQPEAEGVDKPIDSIEEAPATVDASVEQATAAPDAGDAELRTVSASAQPNEVGVQFSPLAIHGFVYEIHKNQKNEAEQFEGLIIMNTTEFVHIGGCSMHIFSCALADPT